MNRPPRISSGGRNETATVSTSRLWTMEFVLCCSYVVVIVVKMMWDGHGMGDENAPFFPLIRHRLSRGWMFGERLVDNSDGQYAGFRDRIPVLFAAMLGYLLLSWLLRVAVDDRSPMQQSSPLMSKLSHGHATRSASALYTASRNGESARAWPAFMLLFSMVFLTVLHGYGIIKIVGLLSAHYALTMMISRVAGGRWMPIAAWGFCIALLFLNDLYKGYAFKNVSPALGFLDNWSGLMPRWYVNFNFSMLRMISFSMDYHWSRTVDHAAIREKYQKLSATSALLPAVETNDEKYRTEVPLTTSTYDYRAFMTYCLYTPLYLAGPIISFNNFQSQIARPKPFQLKQTLIYGARLVAIILLMEFMMHQFYFVAMSKESSVWPLMTPYQLAMFSYFNLKFIWMKLLIIWRFFRFWAMADGIEVLENMTRCMSNNYSPIGFWRSWHRSYNRWLIRYIYIPLGGKDYRLYNTWVIFTFVAVWHDLQLRLLVWGWLISLFILPEVLVGALARKYVGKHWWYKYLAALGGALNTITMILANLVGFAVGIDGLKLIVSKVFTINGLPFLFTVIFTTFIAVLVMFGVREEEKRREALDGRKSNED